MTTAAGDLAINGAVSGTTTTLNSAGAISEGGSGSLTAGTLSGQSAGTTTLTGSNHIGTLGSFSATNFALTNAQALAVNGPLNGGASTTLDHDGGRPGNQWRGQWHDHDAELGWRDQRRQ